MSNKSNLWDISPEGKQSEPTSGRRPNPDVYPSDNTDKKRDKEDRTGDHNNPMPRREPMPGIDETPVR